MCGRGPKCKSDRRSGASGAPNASPPQEPPPVKPFVSSAEYITSGTNREDDAPPLLLFGMPSASTACSEVMEANTSARAALCGLSAAPSSSSVPRSCLLGPPNTTKASHTVISSTAKKAEGSASGGRPPPPQTTEAMSRRGEGSGGLRCGSTAGEVATPLSTKVSAGGGSRIPFLCWLRPPSLRSPPP